MTRNTEKFTLRHASWGSIIGGVVSALAVSLLMSLLGTAIGFGMVDPTSDDPVGGVGTAFGIWSGISLLVSLVVGGFVAGRLSGYAGYAHGFLVWATSLIVALIIATMAVGSAVQMAGSALGSMASAAGSVVSQTGSAAGSLGKGIGELTGKLDAKFDVSGQLNNGDVEDNIKEALQKSGVPALQPDYLSKQLQGAKQDLQQAFEEVRANPSNFDQASQQLMDTLKKRVDGLSDQIDRDAAVKALVNNSQMSQSDAEHTVDEAIDRYHQAVATVKERVNQLEQQVNDSREQADQMIAKAREEAAKAASAMAKSALWAFIGLLIGAAVSAFAGKWGTRQAAKEASETA